MDNITYILFLCQALPTLLALALLRGKPRVVVGFVIIGSTICLLASEINGQLLALFDNDMLYYCTTISPAVEEILKALPVLFFAFFISDKLSSLVQISFATGLGFAILENLIVMQQNIEEVTVLWAFLRGIGAGLMHGVCTVAVGIGISYIRKQKKMFVCGTLSLLFMAMTYHALYNAVIMSSIKYLGFAIPLITYIPINLFYTTRRRSHSKEKQSEESLAPPFYYHNQ